MQIDYLQTLIQDTPILIVVSELNDTRILERHLARASEEFRLLQLNTSRSEHRDVLHYLRSSTGQREFPMVFVHGRHIGGEPELLDHGVLDRPSGAAWMLGWISLAPVALGALCGVRSPER